MTKKNNRHEPSNPYIWLNYVCADKKVYGIPKNGLIIALLSQVTIVQTPEEADIIIDDLIDSGKTIEKYLKYKKPIYVIYVKNTTPDKYRNHKLIKYFKEEKSWISFWWETEHETNDLVARLFERFGEDPNREGLLKTPDRFFKAWDEILAGYKQKTSDILTVFQNESHIDQIVGLSNLEYYSICEHHLLPFYGKAHIFYIPKKSICGISKLKRILDIYSKRLQNQERLTKQIADDIESYLKPLGVAVILEGEHFCMKCRGVKTNAIMKTSDLRGIFREDQKARQELFNLIK